MSENLVRGSRKGMQHNEVLLMRHSNGQFTVTLPRYLVHDLEWKKGDKLVIAPDGRGLMIAKKTVAKKKVAKKATPKKTKKSTTKSDAKPKRRRKA
jgi:bifunctional DNA-binding transcriptional regulator/antitoxin component of YhaV-PrlF toxin-antitoxin module